MATHKIIKRLTNGFVATLFSAIQVAGPVSAFVLLTQPVAAQAAVVQPVANPSLPQSCGLDIAIVIDNSTSISSSEMGQMKTAMTTFTNALAGTPTQFSVTRFASSASVIQPFTSNIANVNTAINGVPVGGGYTNWQDGLTKAASTLPNRTNPNLVLFASDGDPTASSAGPDDTSQPNVHLAPAVTVADSIKTGGSRILALGIGSPTVSRLQAISGPNVNTGNVLTSDVITTDFSNLAAELATFARQTCGGTITTQKIIDQDGNLNTVNDQTPGQGWSFDINGSPSNPAATVTGANGQTVAVKVDAGTYSVNEVAQNGYQLVSASCTGASVNGSLQGSSVVGITVANENIVSCTFVNTPSKGSIKVNKKVDTDGNGTYDGDNAVANGLGFTWSIDGSGSNSMGSTVSEVSTGSHMIGENNVSGYHFTGWYTTSNTDYSCSNPQGTSLPVALTVTSNQVRQITLCNARNTGTLKVVKNVVNNNGGTAQASDFTLRVKQSGVDVSGSPAVGSASGTTYTLPTNTYLVSEDAKAGYTQTELKCVDQANLQVVANPVVLANNQSVVCTITNDDIAPKLTVTKVVVNPYGPPRAASSFPLFVDGTPIVSGVKTQFNAGAHTVSETSQSGYIFTGVSGDCTMNNDIISVLLGLADDATCTLTNTAVQPKLIVKKVVVNNNSGGKQPSDFTMTVSGNTATVANFAGNENGVTIGLNEGSYTVGELADSGYAMSLSPDCSGTIAVGETKTCIVTNDDIPHPSINVVKYGPSTAHEGDTVTYNFQVTNTGDTDLDNVGIADDIASGETCNKTTLSVGESTWCTASYTIPSPQVADVVNHVVASGTDSSSETTVTATDEHTLDVLHPSINVVKTGPSTASAGSTVTYTFTVTNTGDVALNSLTVVDSLTGSGTYVSGDTDLDDKLDLAETWVYTADYVIPSSQKADVVNTVTACGYDAAQYNEEEAAVDGVRFLAINNSKGVQACNQDSHSLSIPQVLGETTSTPPLVVTGQAYPTIATALLFVGSTLALAVTLAPRKKSQR